MEGSEFFLEIPHFIPEDIPSGVKNSLDGLINFFLVGFIGGGWVAKRNHLFTDFKYNNLGYDGSTLLMWKFLR